MIEWTRLMKPYPAGQGRALVEGTIAAAMTWSDPEPDVGLARRAGWGAVSEA